MNKLLKVLIAGTVINFIAVPFFYSQSKSFNFRLSLHDSKKSRFQDLSSSLKSYKISQSKEDQKSADSTVLKDSAFTTKQVSDKKLKMKKKPWLAVLLSAVLPGAGQYYTR